MKKSILWITTAAALVLVIMLFATGCGKSPSSTASEFTKAINERNFGAAYDMLASNSPVRAIAREDFIKNAEASMPQGSVLENFQVTEEKIEGDTATVKWSALQKVPGQTDEPINSSWTMVKENEEWKIQQ